jgi:predicted PurR-regulated permease PerM
MRPDTKPPGETQMRIIWFALTALSVLAIIAVGVAFIWGIGKILNLLGPVLWPLAIAAVLAYLFDPAVNWLERHRISRTWGIIIVFALVVCVISGVLASVIPQMVKETNKLVSKIPGYTQWVQERFSELAQRAEKATSGASSENQSTNAAAAATVESTSTRAPDSLSGSTGSTTNAPVASAPVAQIHNKIVSSATDWFGKLLAAVGAWLLQQLAKVTSLIDVVIAIILIPIYCFYFLREKKWIKSHWSHYLPVRNSRAKDEMIFIIESINQYMIAFFRGQVLVSICSGTLYTIGFVCVGLDYAFLLGFVCMLLTMVPFLGPMVSCIISVILTALQFGDWFHPLMVFVIFAVVVSLENFFYSPRIMGNRVGLHPLVIIVAVLIGITLLGGVLGGVLSIPFAAALRVIMVRYLWKPNNAQ